MQWHIGAVRAVILWGRASEWLGKIKYMHMWAVVEVLMSYCYSSIYNMYMYMYLASYVWCNHNNFKSKMQQESDF